MNDWNTNSAISDPHYDPARVIRAPRGPNKTCKSWITEAAYRMIQNNLDPDVAEDPRNLVVYGGIGMGYSQHAGVVIVCDGTDAAAKRNERVLWNYPNTGVMWHADAGYEEALAFAREQGRKLPMHRV